MFITPLGRQMAAGRPWPGVDQAALEQAFQMRTPPPGAPARTSRTGAYGPSALNGREYDMPITAFGGPRPLNGPTTAPNMEITPRPGGWAPPGPPPTGPYVPAGGFADVGGPAAPTGAASSVLDRTGGNTGVMEETQTYDPGNWGTMRVPYHQGGPDPGPGGGPGNVGQPELPPGPNPPPPPPPPGSGATTTTPLTPPLGDIIDTELPPREAGPTRTTGQPSPGFAGNRDHFAGFNFDREQNQDDSAKDTFLAGAGAGSDDLRWQNSDTAEAWFDQYVRPQMEARGFTVGEVDGDRAFVHTRENPEGTWIDWVQGIDGPNPRLAWQDQSYGGDAAGGSGGGAGGGGGTQGGLGGVDWSMLPGGSNNILQAVLGQGVGGGGDQTTMQQIMAELQALMQGRSSTLTQPALEQAFGSPKTGRL